VIDVVQGIYENNFFPEMQASWQVYPDHIGHQQWPGCFRCHDGEHSAADGRRTIKANDCNACHTILAQGSGEELNLLAPGGQKFNVQPALMPIGFLVRYPSLKRLLNQRLFLLARPLFSTRHPGARLRMTEYRGVISATMIYDRQPINDVFRKMDENAVLGLMDMRGMQRPFFFRLWREAPR